MSELEPDQRTAPPRAYHALIVLPALGILGGAVFASRARPFILGLPFFLAWVVGCVVLTSVVLGVIYRLDEKALGRAARADALGPGASP